MDDDFKMLENIRNRNNRGNNDDDMANEDMVDEEMAESDHPIAQNLPIEEE